MPKAQSFGHGEAHSCVESSTMAREFRGCRRRKRTLSMLDSMPVRQRPPGYITHPKVLMRCLAAAVQYMFVL